MILIQVANACLMVGLQLRTHDAHDSGEPCCDAVLDYADEILLNRLK